MDNAQNSTGLICDGIASAETIDSSAEILMIDGCDLTEFQEGRGVINFEHRTADSHGASANDVVGKVLTAKKIFSEEDCENERQLMYWKTVELPYIYITFRLFDGSDHAGAKALAAIMRDCKKNGEKNIIGLSIEGSTTKKSGNKLINTIAKACAATSRPCNKACVSNILHDPMEKSKEKDSLKKLVEKFNKNEASEFKEKIKELIKDWDGESELTAFIKSKMPEVSDEFLERFTDVVDSFKLKVKKFESIEFNIQKLTKAIQSTLSAPTSLTEHIEFGGKKVKPGSASMVSPDGESKNLAILGHDDETKSFVTIPKDKLSSWTEHDIKKIPSDDKSLKLESYPEEAKQKATVNVSTDGINVHPKASALIEGLDLDPSNKLNKKHSGHSQESFWTKSPSGKTVFIKPEIDLKNKFGDSLRESAYHNVATDFFGLGDYLPATATVKHPQTGQLHTIIEAVHGEHAPDGPMDNQTHINTIKSLGDSGTLDKLGLMDTLLSNDDRHHGNYLFTDNGSVKMIDHGMSLNSDQTQPLYRPDYLDKYDHVRQSESRPKNEEEPLHPETSSWLMSLDPKQFRRSLRQNKVPLENVNEAERRLVEMQKELSANPNSVKFNVYNAPFGIRKQVEQPEEKK